jgi:hypothetical protein
MNSRSINVIPIIGFINAFFFMFGCYSLQNTKCSEVHYYPTSDTILDHSFLNGYIAIDSNNCTYIYTIVNGLIMNNSKKVYQDSILIAWHGETYYQSKPLLYSDLNHGIIDNIGIAYENFFIYYGKRNRNFIQHALFTLDRETTVLSYKQHKTLQFVFFDKSDRLQSVTSFSDLNDTIFRYNKEGYLTKTLVRGTESKKFQEVIDNATMKELNMFYTSEYWQRILDSFSTDFTFPILESEINTLLTR